MSEKCFHCRYWFVEAVIERVPWGTCRRYPPDWWCTDEGQDVWLWPEVKWGQWCGEFFKHRADALAEREAWAEEFKQALKERERLISWWLKHPLYCVDMQDYLNRQYVEDAINDEYGYEGII